MIHTLVLASLGQKPVMTAEVCPDLTGDFYSPIALAPSFLLILSYFSVALVFDVKLIKLLRTRISCMKR